MVEAGGRYEIELEALAPANLVGEIRSSGKPLANAQIWLLAPGTEPSFSLEHMGLSKGDASTDENGHFRLVDVELGERVLLIRHGSRAMQERVHLRLLPGENQANIDLLQTRLEGRVVDTEGRPLPNIEVRPFLAGKESRGAPLYVVMAPGGGMRAAGGDSDNKPGVRTDAGGHYELSGMAAGVPLVLTAEGRFHGRLVSESFVLAPGEQRTTADLILVPAGCLELEILMDGAHPRMGNVTATWMGDEGKPSKVERSVSEGHVELQALRPGRWLVRARSMALGGGVRAGLGELEVQILAGEPSQATLHLEAVD